MEYQILTKEQQAEIVRDKLQQAERDHFVATLDGSTAIAAAAEDRATAASAVLAELGAPAVLPPPEPEPAEPAPEV
jgi:hypothetical protein